MVVDLSGLSVPTVDPLADETMDGNIATGARGFDRGMQAVRVVELLPPKVTVLCCDPFTMVDENRS
jgi:hypothetical protein